MQLDIDFINNNCIPKELFKKGVKPFDYQYEGIQHLYGKTRFLIADDPGLGKTIQLITAVNLIQKVKDINCNSVTKPLKVLVIGTKSIVINWQREIAKWGNSFTEFVVINHDKLIGKGHEKYLRNWDIVIADESHLYIKNQNTLRAKMFLQIIETAERVWLSTATPASKSAEDYYVTLRVLLPDLYGKWSKSQFVKRYCNKVSNPWAHSGVEYKGFNPKNTSELKKVFSVCAIRRKQEEVKKDLPPLTFSDYFADVNYKDLMHFNPAEALEIKKRVMDGETFPDHYQSVMKHNALLKVPSILELLNTYPEDKKVVIFVWHRVVADKLVEEIKKETDRTVDKITGEVSSAIKRQEIIDKFQAGDLGLNTLVLNMQSGGVGINLTAATIGIYVQYPYSAAHWVQSLKRIHRIGSEKPVQIVKVMIEKSIDEEIFSILEDRMKHIKEVGI